MDYEQLMFAIEEPFTFEEAVEEGEWITAMKQEIDSIERNNTWSLVELPMGHRSIGVKWIYKLKKNPKGEIIKHKARLVAKGYVQQKGVDFEEVFAPVARIETVRMVLALTATNGWEVHHLDVKSAFLHGDIHEEVYVDQPEGFQVKGKEHMVYKLSKALYGLKQAPRAWNTRLDHTMKKLDFERCPQEQAVYKRVRQEGMLIVGVYVDDLIITGSNTDEIANFKKQMKEEFEMTDLGVLSYYLGIEVSQTKEGITLKQSTYALKVLRLAGMSECNPCLYPMESKLKLTKEGEGESVDATAYRQLIGSLRYLTHTRPDLSYSVGIVSRFMESPKQDHLKAVKHIMRYIKGTLHYGLRYTNGGDKCLKGYCDSDLAGDVNDRKSTSGMAFYYSENLIAWSSQKQKTVALSSCEAEFMAATTAACEAIWLRGLLSNLTNREAEKVTLFVDNKSAIALMKNPVFHGRSKHIDMRFHFIRESIEEGLVTIEHVDSNEQKADLLTKALGRLKHEQMRELLGVRLLD